MTKKTVRKKTPKPESIYEMARHIGYYDKVSISYKNVFIYTQMIMAMLFIANFYSGGIVGHIGTSAIIAGAGASYFSQKAFHEILQKKGSVFQKVAIVLIGISSLSFFLNYFINFI